MSYLAVRAYLKLIEFEVFLVRDDFQALYEKVRKYPTGRLTPHANITDQISHAVDTACIWYFKEVFCLQRSATTTCLLRSYGVPAQMVIGAQPRPFKAHSWVEVDGTVVGDKPYMRETYALLDRC